MELKIIKKQDNPLLSRTEIKAELNFFKEPIPKKEDVKKKLASIEKANENLVVVKTIYSSFGTGKADVVAYIYKSEEELKNIEPQKKEKKAGGEAAPKEEAKGEQKKEEAPKEEAKKESKEAVKEEKKEEAPREKVKKG